MQGVPLETRIKDGIKKLLRLIGVRAYKPTHRIKVPTLSLDSIVERLGGRVDLLQMDVQGLEEEALRGGLRTLKAGSCRTFLVGTHSAELHAACRQILEENGYVIEYDDPDPGIQPDGLLVATKGALRLSEADEG